MKTTRYTFLCAEVSRTGVDSFVPFDRGALNTAYLVTGGVLSHPSIQLFSCSDALRMSLKQTVT